MDVGFRIGIKKVTQHGMQPIWISPAKFVGKKDGGCRRVVNFKAFNKECSGEPNHTSDLLKLASRIPGVKDTPEKNTSKKTLLFSVLNARNEYHSIRLLEEASKYFGFTMEFRT